MAVTRRSPKRSPARAAARDRRWWSPRSTACRAHGNIIAPPGVPLHYPEHEAIEVFGDPEEYEAAMRGDPVPRFRARLITEGTLSAADADRSPPRSARRCRPRCSSRLESPFPEPEAALNHVYA